MHNMQRRKLAIITSHPIQYNAPVFQLLQKRGVIDFKVFYTWGEDGARSKHDPGFGKAIEWDIPLLDGYEYEFVKNTATQPGSHHFKGIINPDIIQQLKDYAPDKILIFGWSFHSHLKIMRYFKNKVPIIFRGDSTLIDEQKGKKKYIRRIILSWIYKHIDIAMYVGTNNKAYFLKHGIKENQLLYAPHAIDNDRFQNLSKEEIEKAVEWRKQLGFEEDDTVVLFAGKLEPKKNPELLLKIGDRLSDKKVKFLIVGNGVLEKELKEKTKEDSKYVFLDFQNQTIMPLIYHMADIFILPSKGPNETWGLAINEAMACGLPVMASNKCGGAVDLIDNGKNGIVFDTDNIEAPLVFISLLHDNKKVKQEASIISKQRIKNFTFTHIASAIERCILANI